KGVPHLVAAARAGRARVIKVLLRAGAKTDAVAEKSKATALATAAITGHADSAKALAEAGARLGDSECDKYAIHMATIRQDLSIVKALVSGGADLTVGYPQDLNRCPLHLAVIYGMAPLAKYLLKAGSKVNLTDEHGCTPLYSASFVGNLQCVTELLLAGADMMIANADGNTALEASSELGHVAIVNEFIRHGVLRASPPAASAWVAFTALCAAARSGQPEVADVLIKAGVPPAQEGLRRMGPLSCAASSGKLGVARRVLNASGVVDEKDPHGCTPLIRASQMLRPRLAAFLLASGANPSIRSTCGCQNDAMLSIGQGEPDDRSPEAREADFESTRRVLLRGAAHQATSFAWHPLVLKNRGNDRNHAVS
ncbi:unnamed protein product, partial [Ectocarpus fasciculatus]